MKWVILLGVAIVGITQICTWYFMGEILLLPYDDKRQNKYEIYSIIGWCITFWVGGITVGLWLLANIIYAMYGVKL